MRPSVRGRRCSSVGPLSQSVPYGRPDIICHPLTKRSDQLSAKIWSGSAEDNLSSRMVSFEDDYVEVATLVSSFRHLPLPPAASCTFSASSVSTMTLSIPLTPWTMQTASVGTLVTQGHLKWQRGYSRISTVVNKAVVRIRVLPIFSGSYRRYIRISYFNPSYRYVYSRLV